MSRKNILTSLVIWGGLILLWELLVRVGVLNPIFFASPTSIGALAGKGEFWLLFARDSLASLANIIFASVLGYLAVYAVVFLGLQQRYLYQLLLQLNVIFKYFPIPALIPFGILFFGINDAAKIFIIAFAVFIVYFGHVINIIQKEELNYAPLQRSWNISRELGWQRFVHFVFPISNYLNYRVLGNLIIWVVSTSIIVEMILGGEFGYGSRLLQFQQLYQIDRLFAYLLGIVLFGLLFERVLTNFFARLYFDARKILAAVVIAAAVVASVLYQFRSAAIDESRTIVTYQAGLNLPVYVMIEEYNSLNLNLQTVSSGIQAMDALQSGRNPVGGYVDIPNALSGITQNDALTISSQVVETKENPTLFLISNRDVTSNDFSALNDTTVGYFPNNPLIDSGFEFTAFTKQARPQTIDRVGSNDPSTLVQSFVSGTMESVVTPEPFVSQIEKQSGRTRVNPDFSLIQGIDFEALPLAALVLNLDLLTAQEATQLEEDLEASIEYIRTHTVEGRADAELAEILDKYDLDEDMVISQFQTNEEVDFTQTQRMIELIRLIDPNSSFAPADKLTKKEFYRE